MRQPHVGSAGLALDTVFATEVVLPSQLISRAAVDMPEKRLLLAALEDAVGIVQKYGAAVSPKIGALVAETWAWFDADCADHPFAFISICDVLGLEPDAVRRAIHRWRGGDPARRPGPGVVVVRRSNVVGARTRCAAGSSLTRAGYRSRITRWNTPRVIPRPPEEEAVCAT
jgi:hypothetical protein